MPGVHSNGYLLCSLIVFIFFFFKIGRVSVVFLLYCLTTKKVTLVAATNEQFFFSSQQRLPFTHGHSRKSSSANEPLQRTLRTVSPGAGAGAVFIGHDLQVPTALLLERPLVMSSTLLGAYPCLRKSRVHSMVSIFSCTSIVFVLFPPVQNLRPFPHKQPMAGETRGPQKPVQDRSRSSPTGSPA